MTVAKNKNQIKGLSGTIRDAEKTKPYIIVKLEQVQKDLPKMRVHWWDKAISWMDKKKTVTGIALMFSGGVMSAIPGINLLGTGIFYAGSGLAGVGILHKAGKASSYGEKGKFEWNELIQVIIDFLTKLSNKK